MEVLFIDKVRIESKVSIFHFTMIGLLQVGDRIVEVNSEMVDSMSPADLQAMLVRCYIIHQLLDMKSFL